MEKKKIGKAFQKHLVACMCRLPMVMGRVSNLVDPDMFDDPSLGDVVAYTRRHFKEKGELLSYASAVDALGTDKEARLLLKDIYTRDIPDPEYVTDRVVTFAKEKAVKQAVLEAARMIADGKHDGLVDLVRGAVTVGDDFADVGEYLKEGLQKRAKEYINPALVPRVPTGIGLFDEAMRGGLDSGTLGVIFGPPKAGKSNVLCNIGCGAVRAGKNVLHYTLEMDAREVLKIYDKRMVGRKYAALIDSNPREFVQRVQKMHSRVAKHGNVLVKRYGTRTATPSMVRSHLSMVKASGFDPHLVIVDYADIMKAERRLEEFRFQQASIYEDLRAMGQEFCLPVWTGSQSNRSSIDKDIVTIGDLAEAFEKAAIADCLIAICRTLEEKASGTGRLFMAAMRGKEDGTILECIFDLANSFFSVIRLNRPTFKKKTSSSKKNVKPTQEEQEAEGYEHVQKKRTQRTKPRTERG